MRALPWLTLCLLAAVACEPQRPSPEAWRPVWTQARDRIPPASAFAGDPRPRCEEVLGALHEAESALHPTPSPELDARVDRWSRFAGSIVYDCPITEGPFAGFEASLAHLAGLAAAVDAELTRELSPGAPGERR